MNLANLPRRYSRGVFDSAAICWEETRAVKLKLQKRSLLKQMILQLQAEIVFTMIRYVVVALRTYRLKTKGSHPSNVFAKLQRRDIIRVWRPWKDDLGVTRIPPWNQWSGQDAFNKLFQFGPWNQHNGRLWQVHMPGASRQCFACVRLSTWGDLAIATPWCKRQNHTLPLSGLNGTGSCTFSRVILNWQRQDR